MYLIGLTGNIASGKSTVRRILEELGARAIDADALAHEVLLPGTDAWRAVVNAFGREILNADGSVDRQKLGAIVFADPARLRQLEAIVHPAVSKQLGLLLREAREEIVVVEAIKLIEAGLHRFCDAVWLVVTTPEEAERRLVHDRGLSPEAARLRLSAQPPLADKFKVASVVIDNSGDLESARERVLREFLAIDPLKAKDKRPAIAALLGTQPHAAPQASANRPHPVSTRRARPADAALLGELLARAEGTGERLARADVLARFGRWGFWLAESDGQVLGMAGWRAENLVAVVRDLWVKSPDRAAEILSSLFAAIEAEARALACEVIAVITDPSTDRSAAPVLAGSGCAVRSLDSLHPQWKGVAGSELGAGGTLYIKQLAERITTAPV